MLYRRKYACCETTKGCVLYRRTYACCETTKGCVLYRRKYACCETTKGCVLYRRKYAGRAGWDRGPVQFGQPQRSKVDCPLTGLVVEVPQCGCVRHRFGLGFGITKRPAQPL